MGASAADLPAEPDSLAALHLRLEQDRPPEGALRVLIGEVFDWFRRHPGHNALRQLFRELSVHAVGGLGVSAPVPGGLTEMQTRLATLGERWKRDWLAEGEGKAEALIRSAEQRFGPSWRRGARVVTADAGANEDRLDRLLTATSLVMLFDTPKWGRGSSCPAEAGQVRARNAMLERQRLRVKLVQCLRNS
jgi:hypothetical protein